MDRIASVLKFEETPMYSRTILLAAASLAVASMSGATDALTREPHKLKLVREHAKSQSHHYRRLSDFP